MKRFPHSPATISGLVEVAERARGYERRVEAMLEDAVKRKDVAEVATLVRAAGAMLQEQRECLLASSDAPPPPAPKQERDFSKLTKDELKTYRALLLKTMPESLERPEKNAQ